MGSPMAYRCPHCKNPFTIYPDGDVQKGDRTKPRQTIEPVRPPSEVFYEDDKVEVDGKVPPDDGPKVEDERTLYKEVLEQFKELTTRQRCLEETDNQAQEIKKLKRENEKLMGQIFSLEERLSSIDNSKIVDASAGFGGGAAEIARLRKENDDLRSMVEDQSKVINENDKSMLELKKRIDQLEMELKGPRDHSGQKGGPTTSEEGLEVSRFRTSKAEEIENETKRLEIWKKELDSYKSNLEEIALSLVKEKEDIERRTVVLAARERTLDGLGAREGKVAELERALLAKEQDLRQHLRESSTEVGYPGPDVRTEGPSPEKELRITEREAAVKRVEDLLDSRKRELSVLEATLARRGNELSMREAALRELDRSLSERQESLEKARDKLRELKERMNKELGSRKGQEDARSKQKELKEKLESKQVGIQEMETKIKDLLK